MDHAERIRSILAATEDQLRRIAAEAATAGDYQAVVKAAEYARTIAGLSREPTSYVVREPGLRARVRERVRAPQRESGYPRFARRGDHVIRTAWSKSENREYEQRAPVPALHSLVAKLEAVGADGRLFTTLDLLPLVDENGGEIPNYQAYAWLGLLKQVGLVDQHGRQGYTLRSVEDFGSQAIQTFYRLPEKS